MRPSRRRVGVRMLRSKSLVCCVLCLLLVACRPLPAAPTAVAPAEPTATDATLATLAPEPTATTVASPEPTVTPAPATAPPADASPTPGALAAAGPYLAFFVGAQADTELRVVNADGSGGATIPLPDGYAPAQALALADSVAADRGLLVLHHRSDDERGGLTALNLGVLDALTGVLVHEVPLLSPAFPQDLRALYDARVKGQFDDFAGFESGFAYGLTSFAWSPNGRYLAFAGQMDGPSSDLYVLDVETGQRRRLTDGIEQIVDIQWSPDGRRILNGSSNEFGEGMLINFYSADLETDGNVAVGSGAAGFAQWVDADTVAVNGQTNGNFTAFDLTFGDAVTGQIVTVWAGGFRSWSLDADLKTAQIAGCPPRDYSAAACGRFSVDVTTGSATRIGPLSDGSQPVSEPASTPEYRALTDRERNVLRIYADRVEIWPQDGAMIAPAAGPAWQDALSFILAPDHRHAFILLGDQLLAVDLQTGGTRSVAGGLTLAPYRTSLDYVWIERGSVP